MPDDEDPVTMTPELKSAGTRNRLFSFMTGRHGGDVTGQGNTGVRDKLLAAFGTTKRGGLNTREAAKTLGVTQRTVQRWVAADGRQRSKPSAKHWQSLKKASRQAATTKKGRQRAIAAALKTAKTSKHSKRLTIRGTQGPAATPSAKRNYIHRRNSNLELSPDQQQELMMAYAESGDKGAIGWLTTTFDEQYVDDWKFESIDSIEWSDRY